MAGPATRAGGGATRGFLFSDLRNLRASGAAPRRRFETVVGTTSFDANGDAQRQVVTFYRVERAAAAGAGDWVVVKQQDFGPAR